MFNRYAMIAAVCLAPELAQAETKIYLYCEYSTVLTDEFEEKTQSIPVTYIDGKLASIGQPSHCVDEPKYIFTETNAGWTCVNGVNASGEVKSSIYVEVNRFTGRLHRNDFDGHYSARQIAKIWHGRCTAHHDRQF